MLKPITSEQKQRIERIMSNMTLKEKATQIQCVNASQASDEKLIELVDTWKVGSFFVGNQPKERYRLIAKSRRISLD